MGEAGASINIPRGPHLKSYDVPQEVISDILKEGWEDALVWANAFKEDDLSIYFLRVGSAFGSGALKGSKEDCVETVAARIPGLYLSRC